MAGRKDPSAALIRAVGAFFGEEVNHELDLRSVSGRKLGQDVIEHDCSPIHLSRRLTAHQKREAIKRRDVDNETLRSIGRSYNVSAATISRL